MGTRAAGWGGGDTPGLEPGALLVGLEGAVGEVGRDVQLPRAVLMRSFMHLVGTLEGRFSEELRPVRHLRFEGTGGILTTNCDHSHLRKKYKPNFQKSQW